MRNRWKTTKLVGDVLASCFFVFEQAKMTILASAVSDMLGEEWGPPVASDVDLAAELAELEEMDFGELSP